MAESLPPASMQELHLASADGIEALAAYVDTHDLSRVWENLDLTGEGVEFLEGLITDMKGNVEREAGRLAREATDEILRQRRLLDVWKLEERAWRRRERLLLQVARELASLARACIVSGAAFTPDLRQLEKLEKLLD